MKSKSGLTITLKTAKPRNPLALAARQRKAGAHDAHQAARHVRRAEKQNLQQFVRGKKGEED